MTTETIGSPPIQAPSDTSRLSAGGMAPPLCIYHGGCDDGFGAAWAVWKALGDGVVFYPGVYQKAPPDVRGRDVLLVDFSYKRPVLDEMAKLAKSVLVLDHHKTALEDLRDTRTPRPSWQMHSDWIQTPEAAFCHGIYALFDMERSGAGIAWDFFHPDKPRPRFIDYIEDRDLWRKRLPAGDDFTFALRSYPQDFALWDHLAANWQGLIAEGLPIRRYYRARVEELKRHAYKAHLWAPCMIANAPYSFASEVAGEIAGEQDTLFGACYFEVEEGVFQYSLRSSGDFDVSAIAKKFGGGGHKNAAGFTVGAKVHMPYIARAKP